MSFFKGKGSGKTIQITNSVNQNTPPAQTQNTLWVDTSK